MSEPVATTVAVGNSARQCGQNLFQSATCLAQNGQVGMELALNSQIISDRLDSTTPTIFIRLESLTYQSFPSRVNFAGAGIAGLFVIDPTDPSHIRKWTQR